MKRPLIEREYNLMLKCYGKEWTEERFVLWQKLPTEPIEPFKPYKPWLKNQKKI